MTKYLVIAISVLMVSACASSKKDTKAAAPAAKDAKAAKAAPKAAAPKAATSEKTAEGSAMECASGADKRTLEIKATSSTACELHYTKFGNTSQVATSSSGHEHCESVRDKIKGKLEAAGYNCK